MTESGPVDESSGRTVADLVRERVHRFGPIGFDEYMELALYAPGVGFYESGGKAGGDTAGRGQGDFLTSPTLGPLFGAVIARALDAWWHDLGEPDPFVVVEAAAGTGMLGRAVLDASPACAPALRYLLVERSESLRFAQPARLPVEPAAHVLGRLAPEDEEDDEGARVLPGGGPRFASLPDLPAGPVTGVVLANELLDNLPCVVLERGPDAWLEVRVDDEVREVLVPAAPALAAEADRLVPDPVLGGRLPLQRQAATWVRDALRILQRGRVVVVDYAVETTAELTRRAPDEWIRTYRAGARGTGPLDRPGTQDITCEVCVDQLQKVQPVAVDRSQADFLAAWGIGDLVGAADATWREQAATGGLDALKARSRVAEGAALTDLEGLGSFRVLEWVV